jgi:hypothetical protein
MSMAAIAPPTGTRGNAPPLTAEQIINLVSNQANGWTTEDDGKPYDAKAERQVKITPSDRRGQTINGVKVDVPAFHNGQVTGAGVMDVSEWFARQIIAASIIMAESGGYPENTNVNGPDSTAPGSVDRGLWQWNSQWWPQITDAAAFNPESSTILAWLASNGYSDWSPWRGSRGLDPTSAPAVEIRQAFGQMRGIVVDDTPILSWIDKNANGTPDAVEALGGWSGIAKSLGRILANLLNPDWWRRAGIVVLGVIMVIAAIALIR